jgi:glyoxylase-like metal-dependent hydrolase (beta-lactamase superfamily II)
LTEPKIIDTKMHGKDGITGAFLLQGATTTLIETGPLSSFDAVTAGLRTHGVERLDWIVVTHIHLDHAGAAGALTKVFPEARVAVHTVGAPHLVDPSKLWASAARIYGGKMEHLWGGVEPVPEDRLVMLDDGDRVDLGDRTLTAYDTPGHARHHHTYLDDATGIAFVGDALGVRLRDVGIVRPATPPPEFHLDQAVHSIDRIRGIEAQSLWLTHYGAANAGRHALDVAGACDAAIDSLQTWAKLIREARVESRDPSVVTKSVRDAIRHAQEERLAPEDLDRMEQTTSYSMNVAGYLRYFDKTEPLARGLGT